MERRKYLLAVVVTVVTALGAAHAQYPGPNGGFVYPPPVRTIILPPGYTLGPSGTVVRAPAPVPTGVAATTSSCCSGSSSGGSNDCAPRLRTVVNPDCGPKTDCTDIPPDVSGKIEEKLSEIKFYKDTKSFEDTVDVPVVCRKREQEIKFDKITIRLDPCCEIDVCVPSKDCWTTSTVCELCPKVVKLEKRIRQSGNVDVVALGVPGLPKQWVLMTNATEAEAKAKFLKLP
jgi:hypothetical protein